MINIVTVEREYGSGADYIGRSVASKLGWKFWDHEITDEIARRLNCKAETVEQHEERLDSMFYRLMKAFMRGSFEARVETSNFEVLDGEHLATLFEKVIAGIAEEGKCVIVGRGAPWFLRERSDVFNVFLYAPYDEKLRRTMAQGKNRRDAEHLIATVDHDRAAFIHKYYNKEWPDKYLYNMLLNVSTGDEIAVGTILEGIRLLDK